MRTAKLFVHGGSQAVRLLEALQRSRARKLYVRKVGGEVVVGRRPRHPMPMR
jgi:virulence-associated protein VagC